MTREIKFRAWDLSNKKWYRNTESLSINQIGNLEFLDFMQFTGLKDKSGKEIYEGDIVRWDNGTYVIKWNGFYGWMMQDDREDWDCPNLYAQERAEQSGFCRVEIIGNIHENPQLMNPENYPDLVGKVKEIYD